MTIYFFLENKKEEGLFLRGNHCLWGGRRGGWGEREREGEGEREG